MQKTEYLVPELNNQIFDRKKRCDFDLTWDWVTPISPVWFSFCDLSLTVSKMVSAADQQNAQNMSYTHKNVPLVVQLYPLDIYLSSGRRKSLVYLMQQ